LKWIDTATGSTPIPIVATAGADEVRGAAWGADDVIVYAPAFTGPLFSIRLNGGGTGLPAVRLPAGDEIGTARFPWFLSDGRRFVFFGAQGTGTEPGALYLGRVGSLDFKRLGPAQSSAVFAPPGFLIYSRGEGLIAHRFDDEREELAGDATPLGIVMGGSLNVSGLRSLSISTTGVLVFRPDQRNLNQVVWVDRAGRDVGATTEAGQAWHYSPRVSPDGRLMVISHYGLSGGLGELWIHDLSRKLSTRLTFGDGDDFGALWTGPRELVYLSSRPAALGNIYRVHLDRPQERKLWLAGDVTQIPLAMTPDGRVVVQRFEANGRGGLWIRRLEGEDELKPLGQSSASEMGANVSPDGRWLAYASDVAGRWEVYVRRLDGQGAETRISGAGGTQPLWRRDRRELFYVDAAGRMMAVPIAAAAGAEEGLIPGDPVPLFEARLEEANERQYEATADGQRFVLNRSPVFDTVPISVVLDWRALLGDGVRPPR